MAEPVTARSDRDGPRFIYLADHHTGTGIQIDGPTTRGKVAVCVAGTERRSIPTELLGVSGEGTRLGLARLGRHASEVGFLYINW